MYEVVTIARKVKTDELLCIYKSTTPTLDKVTGEFIPTGSVWARNLDDMERSFHMDAKLRK